MAAGNSIDALRIAVSLGQTHAGGLISGDDLRQLALGLPVAEAHQSNAPRAGIVLKGVTIEGRVNLDNASSLHCGPVVPLEFHGCTLIGGFSGEHSHFGRLSFSNCVFVNDPKAGNPDEQCLIPTINLSGAQLNRRLDMEGVKPQSDDDWLWIEASGLHVGGGINLSSAQLRAPPSSLLKEGQSRTALNLILAEIDGDLAFDEGSSAEGELKLRGIKVKGDFWLDSAKLKNAGARALFLQGAKIDGFLSLQPFEKERKIEFECEGLIDLTALKVGRSLSCTHARITGNIKATDLSIGDDLYIHAQVKGSINLSHVIVGGSLDLSKLQMRRQESGAGKGVQPPNASHPEPTLSLNEGRIGRALRLAPGKDVAGVCFPEGGTADLTGLVCDTLEDEIGQRWGQQARLKMNQFSYSRTGWLSEAEQRSDGRCDPEPHRRPSQTMLADWLRAKWAEGHGPLRWLPPSARLRRGGYWAPWQLRRNWIHQQSAVQRRDSVTLARHVFHERDYCPQPFEQAVRVARAEGREDFATHFEMLKQRIEWGFFNRQVRWWFGFAGILLAAAWLVFHQPSHPDGVYNWALFWGTMATLAVTLFLMVGASAVHAALCRSFGLKNEMVSHALTWMAFFLPVLLLVAHTVWWDEPFHLLVAALIFVLIRFIAVFAHALMRFGFGYLRRPVRAVITLIVAFLIGWWGVHIANVHNMLVIAIEPNASAVSVDPHAHYPEAHDETGPVQLPGSLFVASEGQVRRELSCAATISEPLYALDVLIPIVDLGEEHRCEVRRIAEHRPPSRPQRRIVHPDRLGIAQLIESVPDLPFNNHRFWWWMKALYAVCGWIFVSLAILTFAQVNKAHGEPAHREK